MLLDWLTSGGILPFNPAASVRGPKHIIKRGKTPLLTASEARQLLDSIELLGLAWWYRVRPTHMLTLVAKFISCYH